MITADAIHVNIDGKQILDDISLQIPFSKVTAILGPNGAGKSTLLKCLAGFEPVDSGQIKLDNRELDDFSTQELAIIRTVLSQSVSVDFPFTAIEIVKMGRTPFNSAARDDEIAFHALDAVNATQMRDRVFPTLSGGEQQRIQLARVIAQLWDQQHGYLFLDEPTSALDLKYQHQTIQLLKQLAEQRKMAIIIVMHDLNLAMRYADQVLLMKEGKLFDVGETSQVLSADNIETVFEIPAEAVFI